MIHQDNRTLFKREGQRELPNMCNLYNNIFFLYHIIYLILITHLFSFPIVLFDLQKIILNKISLHATRHLKAFETRNSHATEHINFNYWKKKNNYEKYINWKKKENGMHLDNFDLKLSMILGSRLWSCWFFWVNGVSALFCLSHSWVWGVSVVRKSLG